MRDSSRDCHACCGRTGCAIEDTPRCERCGEVFCDYCMPSHLAEEHPREDAAPLDDPDYDLTGLPQYSPEQVREFVKRFGLPAETLTRRRAS